MDIIKKTINLEAYKSHTPAIFPLITVYDDGAWHEKGIVPPVENNATWGNVLCDCVDGGFTASTADIMAKYFEIIQIARSGIKTKRMVKNGDVYYTEFYDDEVRSYLYRVHSIDDFVWVREGILADTGENTLSQEEVFVKFVTNDDYDRYVELGGQSLIDFVETEIIGMLYVPSDITGEKVPDKFYISQIPTWLEWFDKNEEQSARKDCCSSGEWAKRGGDAMRDFLKENYYMWTQQHEKCLTRINSGLCKTPVLEIPVLLTQNYDDIGVMSVFDADAPYEYANDPNYAENWDPYTGETIKSESKIESLRSKIKLYDDYGNLLDFVGDVDAEVEPPYREGEAFNVFYDAKNKEYVGDYISKTIYYDGDGNTAHTISDLLGIPVKVDVEYVIGGKYENSASISCTADVSEVNYNQGSNIGITITAPNNKEWFVTSNCDWYRLNVSSGIGTTNNVVLTIDDNTSTTETRMATVVLVTKDVYREECMCTVIQKAAPNMVTCNFNGSSPNSLMFTGNSLSERVTIKCNGSGWYIKSKPDFVDITPTNGSDGVSVGVTIRCDAYDGTIQRDGKVVFAAVDNSMVTYSVSIVQTKPGQGTVVFIASFGSVGVSSTTIDYQDSAVIKGYIATQQGGYPTLVSLDDSWSYEVVNSSTANLLTIERVEEDNNIVLRVTNKNATPNTLTSQIRVYNNQESGLTYTVNATLVKTSSVMLSVSPSEPNIIAVGVDKVYTVSITGDTADSWEPLVVFTGDTAHGVDVNTVVSYSKTGVNKFKVTNKNNTSNTLAAIIVAKHKTSSAHSNQVLLALTNPPTYDLYVMMHKTSFNQQFNIDIWPSSTNGLNGTSVNFKCDMNQQECGFPPTSIIKDTNKKYYIRFNAPDDGTSPVTTSADVKLVNGASNVVWNKTIRLGEAYEFYSNYFENGSYLPILIKINTP